MRLAVISDIHGNLAALEAVLADIKARGVDRTVNLGDCVTSPLWPREKLSKHCSRCRYRPCAETMIAGSRSFQMTSSRRQAGLRVTH